MNTLKLSDYQISLLKEALLQTEIARNKENANAGIPFQVLHEIIDNQLK